ncbi:hypothetical protein [uncultured Thiodictyon sp.]|jgi:hypothetical protein|uniref:hypothetical protein n=1 Tax=uncultured Thiodictyon sp. TaxID=1846217 RepID=UPI0025D4149B|nr:hypothetical protein [uncultured Thiodictyon sp.]
MSATLRRRLHLLEVAHEQRELAQSTRNPARRWALLNLVVRTAAGEDPAPWRAAMEALPTVPATDRRELTSTERTMRVLALLCREARASAPYRDLLAVAVGAGLADPRQVRWMREAGLLIGQETTT